MASALTEIELRQIRADTPASGARAHFAHGSCSLPPASVCAAQRVWLASEEQFGTLHSLQIFDGDLQGVRRSVAALIGAQAHQIALVHSSSQGWATAFNAACAIGRDIDVFTTEHEWGANAMNLLQARQHGRIAGLHVLYDGPGAAAQQVASRLTDLRPECLPVVTLQAVNPVDGGLTDTSGIADAVHRRDGLVFIDASHAVGQVPVDVRSIGCDVMVFPARKWLRGPKGIGVLFLSDRALGVLGAPPALDIASASWESAGHCLPYPDRRRFEAYEFHPGLRLALGAACDDAMRIGVDRIAARNLVVRQKVDDAVAAIPALRRLHADHPTALMTYRIHAPLGAALLTHLARAGIDASLIHHQYARWALEAREASVLLRLTPHYFTSDIEIAQLREALAALPAEFSLAP